MGSPEEATSSTQTSRSGRNAPRSKKGCSTCRARKVKCDETRNGLSASCNRCLKSQIRCEWDQPVPRRKSTARWSKSIPTTGASPNSPLNHTESFEVTQSVASVKSPVFTPDTLATVTTPIFETPSTSPGVFSSTISKSPNTLLLSPQDLESFEYVSRSLMVLRFGKPWRWSSMRYVHTRIAPRESGVLRAFVAVASLELRARELHKIQDPTVSFETIRKAHSFEKNASHALHLAMQDLSLILDRLAQSPNNHEDLETLFSMWFLILHFGIYDSDLVQASYLHLNGIRGFVAEYFHSTSGSRIATLPPAAKQLLVFICYLDVMLALGGLGGGKLSMDLMEAPLDSPIHFDRLFEEARVCVPQLWGKEYPVDELLDDLENYRPLKLVHLCQKFKLRVWNLGKSVIRNSASPEETRDLWKDIEHLGETFYDVRLLARSVSCTDGRRVIWTVYHGCLDFYALKLLYSCAVDFNDRPFWMEETIAELLRIAHKALGEDPQHIYRYAWPLRMAMLKVKDPIHQEWLQGQIKKASILLSNLGIPSTLCDTECTPQALFSDHE